jgi:hypothetical protein
MAAETTLEDQIKVIKTQLDFLLTVEKVKEPEFFNAAADRVIKSVSKLKSDELKAAPKVKKVSIDTQPNPGEAWPKLAEIRSPPPRTTLPKKTYDAKTIGAKYYVNFHSSTYHWISEWRPQSSILVKDGSITVKMRVDIGKPEINFKVGTSITKWFPLLETDQAVDCMDDEGNPVIMKFKLLPNVTAE